MLAVILKGYPRLSETFIAQELLGLEGAGQRLVIFSLRRPTDPTVHPVHRQIRAPVVYLPEYLYQEPKRVLRSLARAARLPGFKSALTRWLRDVLRDPTPNRFRRFGQAAVLAVELPEEAKRLHAHFIHTPSAVTRYAALMTGLPWSCTAHAKDIWTSPDWELKANLAASQWTATCTAAGRNHLAGLAAEPHKVHLIYHGLDLARFAPHTTPSSSRDGRDPAAPVRLLAVGRVVEKKGFDVLLRALALLPQSVHWQLTHIGGGDKRANTERLAAHLGLPDRIRWLGARDQHVVLDGYRSADLFVLPCRIADNGDRDGLPNVLIEAQSQGLACISTRVSGIPELIVSGETGILVEPDNPQALADTLQNLIADPAERHRLGLAGERRVRGHFDARIGLQALLTLIGNRKPGSRDREGDVRSRRSERQSISDI
ncbi:MAG: glycosyltransferase family 4 protein [Hyphomicrobiaceae bacterium]